MTDTAPVTPPKLTCIRNSTSGASDAGTTEGDYDAQERLSQTEAVGAPDAADVNELLQVTSPQGRATPDPGLETNARPSTERRPDEQENGDELCEQHTTTHSRNTAYQKVKNEEVPTIVTADGGLALTVKTEGSLPLPPDEEDERPTKGYELNENKKDVKIEPGQPNPDDSYVFVPSQSYEHPPIMDQMPTNRRIALINDAVN